MSKKIKINKVNMDIKPKINEIIGYLELADPNALEILRNKFPEYETILQQGITLGDDKSLFSNTNEVLVRGVASKTGLESVLKKCDELLPILKNKLKTLGNIQLGSQILVGISGASLLTQLVNTIPYITIITGILTLLGSSLTLFVQHRSGTILNNSQSIFGLYDKLIDNKFEAEQQLLEVDLALQVFNVNSPDRLVTVVNKSNQICLEIRKIIEKM
jgi:hypothetical protein